MRLQTIQLLGFKSFPDRTELKILPGITAIVGPNGCGKTNVADALRWALGEQSARTLRGQRMEDVIFHGSPSRRPMAMAEVVLTFTNDGSLGVPWSEVSVGRRLYRDGESEYLLNKTPCRLRDVQELLLGTGVNPRAYALMEQERLTALLTARPADRRVLIEEAAGITRYRQQRAETLAKLEATRQNLLRVRDVMEEVRRQLTALERQARRAQQYKALQAERRALEQALLAAEHARLTAEEAAATAQEQHARDSVEALRARAAGLAAAEEALRAELLALEQRTADRRHARDRAALELEALLARLEQLRVTEADLEAERARVEEEARGLAARRLALAQERAQRAEQAGALRQEFAALRARAEEHERSLDALRRRLRAAREAAEASRQGQVELAERRTALGQALATLAERQGQLGRRLERLRAEAEQAAREREALEQERQEAEARLEMALAGLAGAGEELRALAARAGTLAREREAAAAAAEEARLQLAADRSSLGALEELEAQRAGYGRGVQAVFAAARAARLTGIVGTVADVLEVPRDLERAVEAALGERLQWIVVDTFATAKAALGYLGEDGGGQATFLPLDRLEAVAEAHAPADQGVLGVAGRLVGSQHPAVSQTLLGSVVVVRDLGAAERLWSGNGNGTSFVTVAGEVLLPPGAVGGGRAPAGGDASLLGRKRVIRELRARVVATERALEVAAARLRAAESEAAVVAEAQERAGRLREACEAARLGAAKDLERIRREAERARLYAEALQVEAAQVAAEAEAVAREQAARQAELDAIQADARRVEAEAAALRDAVARDAEAEAAQAQAFLDVQVELAALAGRIEAAEEEGRRLAAEEADTEARLATGRERVLTLAARRQECQADRAPLGERAEAARRARDEAERQAQETAEALEALRARLLEAGAARREADAELERALRALEELRLRATELRVRRQEVEADARRRFDVGPEALRSACDPTLDLAAARARQEELTQRIAAMEPVNLVADEEYRELDGRLGFLRAQHDDLAASVRDLERALRGMTRTAHERFREAFDAINRHFQDLFARLFEGGRAELRLVETAEDGDPLDAGIELMAQPRGKRLQSVSLLSGGEKALTGLALLFAIFYYRPSPFCLLDEVDAPLDDANIDRFTRALRELARQTQFLVITHNRKTMEAADVLYGITMEEPGLSRVVSVSLS